MNKSSHELASTIASLARVPLFDGCSVRELERLAATSTPLAFHPGDVLCEEGEGSTECYVVVEGEVDVTTGGRTVKTVGPVQAVCELGPIEGRPRCATVTAATRLFTYAISREELAHLLEGSPLAAEGMRKELSRRYG